MRFTVKAKLASAFGVVILLSMVAGGVAYLKLNDMAGTTEHLTARAGRLAKVADLRNRFCFRSERRRTLFWHSMPLRRTGSSRRSPSRAKTP